MDNRPSRTHVTIEPGGTLYFSTPQWKAPSLFERFFGPPEPFHRALAWPTPSTLTPHQTTYGATDMPHDHPHLRPDRETINDLTHRLHEALIERGSLVSAFEKERMRLQGELVHARLDAEAGCAVMNELRAALSLKEGDSVIRAVEDVRDRYNRAAHRADELYRQRVALDARVAELTDKLVARETPPGSYLIRAPGVYVATPDENDPSGGIVVTKRLLKDAVVLTAGDNDEAVTWWQLYRDGITGCLTAWCPPQGLHDLIAGIAKHYIDPSAWPCTAGMDMGKPGDDMTTGRMCSDAESFAAREEIVSMRPVKGDPQVDRSITGRLATLERQQQTMQALLSEEAGRRHRLEAWARQFGAHGTLDSGYGLVPQYVRPLDSMEPKP